MSHEPAINSPTSNVIDLRSSDVANRSTTTSSATQRIIEKVLRETKRSKVTYEQLKYCFREVRRLAGIEVPQKREALIELPTDSQLERFYSVIKDPVHRLIFRTLEGTGLRISELCNLLVSRIDFVQQQAFVAQGKGGKDRLILFSSHLGSQLQLHLSGRKNKYLFESIRHDQFSSRQIQRLADKYSELSGVKVHPHLLRHLFATRLAAAGLSEDQRKILCGHSKKSNAQQTYTHLALSMVKDDALKVINSWTL